VHIYNTLGREIQQFQPITPGTVGLYTCGPTVYNFAHIGNLRTYLFEDFLRRTLEYLSFSVTHVMNVTDVGHLTDDADEGEDKMTKSAREKGMSVWDIAQFYTDAFFRDVDRLNIRKPHIVCRATDHIQDMIALIRRIEANGHTYVAGGNVYFDISTFPRYGELALLDRQELLAGARIGVDENKKNPHDFVLWFTKGKFEHQAMLWDSPWGKGYPGWHIECSAMSMKYLGDHFDIHTGGVDHIPVHHSNEIAQSEAATDTKWVNYWIHGEFLLMENAKMSKSAGGFLTLDALVESGYEPLDYRYFCLGGHYRKQISFTREAMDAARTGRKNLRDNLMRLRQESEPTALDALADAAKAHHRRFVDHISHDLNMPRALSDLWQLLKDTDVSAGDRLGLAFEMDRVLGLQLQESSEFELDQEIQALIDERTRARAEREFARADEIRAELSKRGVVLEDTPQGTRWHRE
jgi:cysteinyl-tRNA synthetase